MSLFDFGPSFVSGRPRRALLQEERPERGVAVAVGLAARAGVDLAVREQLVQLRPGRDLPGVDRRQVMRRPHLDVLVVVAAEDVERLRRRDRLLDHRDRVGHGQGELEAEVGLRLLLNLGRRPLDAERDHIQRSGERALLRRGRRRRARERADTRHRRCGRTTSQKEVPATHAAGLVLGLRPGQTLMLAQLLDEFISVDLELVRHERTPFSSPSTRGSRLPTWAHPTARQQHPRCRNRSEHEWRSAVECSLYTGPSRTSQLACSHRSPD